MVWWTWAWSPTARLPDNFCPLPLSMLHSWIWTPLYHAAIETMISKFQLNCYSIFVYKMYISNLNSCKGAAGWNALSPKVTLWLSVQWTHHQHHHHGCGHDHKDRGGSWWRLNRREGKAPAARPKPFLATCSPAHPMWRVPFVLEIT